MPYVGNLLRIGELSRQRISLNLNQENRVTLKKPAYLYADQIHQIELTLNTNSVHFSAVELKKDPIKIGNSIQFTFFDSTNVDYDNITRGLITALYFQIPDEPRPRPTPQPKNEEPPPSTSGFRSQSNTSTSQADPGIRVFSTPALTNFQSTSNIRYRQNAPQPSTSRSTFGRFNYNPRP